MPIFTTKANKRRKLIISFLIILLCCMMTVIGNLTSDSEKNEFHTISYVKIAEERLDFFSETSDMINAKEQQRSEAEEAFVSIIANKAEMETTVLTLEETAEHLKELEEEASSKVTRFVPEEVEAIYQEASQYMNNVTLDEESIKKVLEEVEEEIATIESAKIIVKEIDEKARNLPTPIFISTTSRDEILNMDSQTSDLEEEITQEAQYVIELLSEIEELENKILEYYERAQNFDIMSEISLLSEEDEANVKLLAQLIFHEAGICDEEEQYRVACVVMNRTQSDLYPDTVRGVIYDAKYTKQYTSTGMFYSCTLPEYVYRIAYDVYVNGVRILPENVIGQMQGKPSSSRYEIYEKTDWHYFFSVKE